MCTCIGRPLGDVFDDHGLVEHADGTPEPLRTQLIELFTGLHISDNGRLLAELLEQLVDAWSVAGQDIVLIGHSMRGLVARSALHRARGGPDEAGPTRSTGCPRPVRWRVPTPRPNPLS